MNLKSITFGTSLAIVFGITLSSIGAIFGDIVGLVVGRDSKKS
ncbi:hypothetical protein JNUCC74_01085 [Cerasibacillus sp. JNUCC 74]